MRETKLPVTDEFFHSVHGVWTALTLLGERELNELY